MIGETDEDKKHSLLLVGADAFSFDWGGWEALATHLRWG